MTPAAKFVKTDAWTSPVVMLSGARVDIAVLLISVAVAVPVTAGAPVNVKSAARQKGSVVKISVKMMPDNAEKVKCASLQAQ